ncbi:MAG: hypothetical protein K2K70_03480 [Lachnospiraceae bacterium]|nr:hypothetical protein [Lachnospiraceae bacterium]
MGFVFELFYDLFFEGTLDLTLKIGTSKKVPMFFRILALIVFLVLYVGIIVLLSVYGVDALRSNDLFGGCLCILTALIVLIGGIILTVKRRKKVPETE